MNVISFSLMRWSPCHGLSWLDSVGRFEVMRVSNAVLT